MPEAVGYEVTLLVYQITSNPPDYEKYLSLTSIFCCSSIDLFVPNLCCLAVCTDNAQPFVVTEDLERILLAHLSGQTRTYQDSSS